MEIQMNGTRNVEVLQQRSNRTANYRVTSIRTTLVIQRLWVESFNFFRLEATSPQMVDTSL